MRDIITLQTHTREILVDVTREIEAVVARSGVRDGLVSVYAQGATCAMMVDEKHPCFSPFGRAPHAQIRSRRICQENWDDSVRTDVVHLLRKLIPPGVWLHDAQDGNGDAHLKAGLVGPSETIPLIDGRLGLSRWQNIFFCEFDGPRRERRIVRTVLADH
jgi:secondary thiamine-phosphate synthase enzyme